jgi:NAD-dependent deacetylase
MTLDADLRSVAARWSPRARWTVLTGAGVSAASGVPTFRSADGLWKNLRPEDLATPEAFARDPQRVWEWYDWRRQKIAAARPNRAHEVLASWSQRQAGFRLITQNVDGLHERAGSARVIRFHGSIWDIRCSKSCGGPGSSWTDMRAPLPELPVHCPDCGGLARPGVVWFGEPIDRGELLGSEEALDCDVCLVIGTSSVVYPAAALASQARQRGAWTVEINPEPGAADVDLVIRGKAEEVLPEIDSIID